MNEYHCNWSTELCFASIENKLSSSAYSFVTSTLTCLHCSSQVFNKRYCSVMSRGTLAKRRKQPLRSNCSAADRSSTTGREMQRVSGGGTWWPAWLSERLWSACSATPSCQLNRREYWRSWMMRPRSRSSGGHGLEPTPDYVDKKQDFRFYFGGALRFVSKLWFVKYKLIVVQK